MLAESAIVVILLQVGTLARDVLAWGAELLGVVQCAPGVVPSPELRERPGPPQLRGRVRRLALEDAVVRRERGLRVVLDHGHGREPQQVLGAPGIDGEPFFIGLRGPVEVLHVQTNETERVEDLGVVGAAPHRLLEARQRVLGLSPAGAPHAAFARARRRRRRDARCGVIRREGLVVAMGQLEGVSELDPRDGIVGEPALQLRHLEPRRLEIAGEGEHAHEEPPRAEVVGLPRELRAQEDDRLPFPVHAYELLRAIDGSRRCAAAGKRAREDEGFQTSRHVVMEARMDIRTIGVLGAGQMGGGIAQVAAAAGYDVVLADASIELAQKGRSKIDAILGKQVEKGKIKNEDKDALVARIKPVASSADFGTCDLVIEAATENVDLKLKLFRGCDDAMKPGAILASNTSSISLTRLAGVTKRPELVIGMHFMNPPPLMKLVEIVRAVQTSEPTYVAVRAAAEKMGKTVTVSRDAPGFLVNRILVPMLCEACFALQEGVGSAEDIDTGAKLGLNHPMGPLELSDLIGLDTVLAIADVLHKDIGDDKYRAPTLLRNLVAAGWTGKKSGRGFYVYDESGKKKA